LTESLLEFYQAKALYNEGKAVAGNGISAIRHNECCSQGQPRKHLEGRKRCLCYKAPVAKVILNNEFLTGLFRTRNRKLFVGDIRTPEGRKLLRFKAINSFQMVAENSIDFLHTNG